MCISRILSETLRYTGTIYNRNNKYRYIDRGKKIIYLRVEVGRLRSFFESIRVDEETG